VTSEDKTLANYKLQYAALKEKMHQFPDTQFIVWTPAALVEEVTSEEEGLLTKDFTEWMKTEWDEDGDNIHLWDFYALETEGGLFLKKEYSNGEKDSHPNEEFSREAAPSLAEKIVEVVRQWEVESRESH